MPEFHNDSTSPSRVPSVKGASCNETEKAKELSDDPNNVTEDDGEIVREPEYPTKARLFIIVIAVALSIFLMSLDMV